MNCLKRQWVSALICGFAISGCVGESDIVTPETTSSSSYSSSADMAVVHNNFSDLVGQCFSYKNSLSGGSTNGGQLVTTQESFLILSSDSLLALGSMDTISLTLHADGSWYFPLANGTLINSNSNALWVPSTLNGASLSMGCDTASLLLVKDIPGYSLLVKPGTINTLYKSGLDSVGTPTWEDATDDILVSDTADHSGNFAGRIYGAFIRDVDTATVIGGKRLVIQNYVYEWTTGEFLTSYILEGVGSIYISAIYGGTPASNVLMYSADTAIRKEVCETLVTIPQGFPCP